MVKVFKRFDASACPAQSYCARANCTSPIVLSLSRLQCPWGATIVTIQEKQIEKHASAVHRLGDLPLKDKSRSKSIDREKSRYRKLEDDREATAVIGYTEVDEGGKEECIGICFTSTKPTHTSQRIVQPRRIGLSDGTISYLGIEIPLKIRLNIAKTKFPIVYLK
ncbi:hypothetical protein HZH68_007489 [Vespula germanica]|uniref:Uncharacterized protein n=1 Tax=Vespula germanica TaxID=30212 RepID=A0A834KB63_VESGE|nr:hypothetical protein HZH68_007489 [Vespula germanica]